MQVAKIEKHQIWIDFLKPEIEIEVVRMQKENINFGVPTVSLTVLFFVMKFNSWQKSRAVMNYKTGNRAVTFDNKRLLKIHVPDNLSDESDLKLYC